MSFAGRQPLLESKEVCGEDIALRRCYISAPPLALTEMELLEVGDAEAHLWWARWDADASIAHLNGLLTEEEHVRCQRFVFERSRREFVLTRALVRTRLSQYAAVDPRDWRFRTNEWGRPEIETPALELPLRFNLSHSGGVIVCLVARGRDVGVDVEAIHRVSDRADVAARFFAPSEVAALCALPEHEQELRFFDYWTHKEAYIKARGMGLAIPLDAFSFSLGEGTHETTVAFDERIDDRPSRWQFDHFRPTERHPVATAIERRVAGERVIIVVRETSLGSW